MPNVKSARKRVKTNERDRMRNRMAISTLRTALKQVNAAIEKGDAEAVKTALPKVLRLIGRTRQKGIIHKSKAARQESRLVKRAAALLAK